MNFKNHIGDILEIIYQDKSGQLSQRVIRVIDAKGSIIKAHCYKRNKVRFFTINNILGYKLVRSRGYAS